VHHFSNHDERREADVRRNDERGESLVEIVMALVLLSLVVSALMAGLATAARATRFQRNLVTIDTVMRSYAEATKNAVRRDCANYSNLAYSLAPYAAPVGYTVSQVPAALACPLPPAVPTQTLTLTVSSGGTTRTMDIVVRRP
jgi:type II secretory pathway pseudopilin PulG